MLGLYPELGQFTFLLFALAAHLLLMIYAACGTFARVFARARLIARASAPTNGLAQRLRRRQVKVGRVRALSTFFFNLPSLPIG